MAMAEKFLPRFLTAIGLFMFVQLLVFWNRMAEFGDNKLTLEAEVASLERKKGELHHRIVELERDKHRLELQVEKLDFKIKDTLPLAKDRLNMPLIFFITPTKRRPTQKADLTRLLQTLSSVPNLYWLVVEDADHPSPVIAEALAKSGVRSTHLAVLTPINQRLGDKDPNWKLPRGVKQRNAALKWIRSNFPTLQKGAVYFGDDDNVYDWKLFNEIRTVQNVGVWPVGLVGGRIVEAPYLNDNGQVVGFNSLWKPERPFPIDMAAFAVNITLLLRHSQAEFSFDVPRGYQESHFLTALGLKRTDLEPKADMCTNVYVWHTRTENAILPKTEKLKLQNLSLMTNLEKRMGERKGQNHYYPPDFNYKVHKNLNAYHGTHALRERKKKDGVLIIRFEMPFNVWCMGCKNHVGMGVRYNAEKKKIGMYYTTPLFQFRMKCHLCDNYFIIRTDPKNFDYELVEGLERQERRFDPADVDNLGAVDRNFAQKLAADAMLKAEHVRDDKEKSETSEGQINKLQRIQSRMKDGYGLNCELRRQFRAEKKCLNEKRAADDNMKKRLSLDIALQPSTSQDTIMAQRMMRLKHVKSDDERRQEQRQAIQESPIFKKEGNRLKLKIRPSYVSSNKEKDITNLITKKSLNPIGPSTNNLEQIPQNTLKTSTLVDYESDNSSIHSQ